MGLKDVNEYLHRVLQIAVRQSLGKRTLELLNTAKLMEGNPLLLRLKELDALEKVAEKVEKITVVGGLNALLERTLA